MTDSDSSEGDKPSRGPLVLNIAGLVVSIGTFMSFDFQNCGDGRELVWERESPADSLDLFNVAHRLFV